MPGTTGQLPFAAKMHATVAPVATDVNSTWVVGKAPRTGTVTAITFIANAAIDGDDTNTRAFSIVNKGTDGNGTTEIATLALPNANNVVAFVGEAFTLSAVDNAKDVTAGDVIVCVETTPGTGVANPGGVLEISIGNTNT